jgi:hypothetical protein
MSDLDEPKKNKSDEQIWIRVKNPKAPAATRAIDGTF